MNAKQARIKSDVKQLSLLEQFVMQKIQQASQEGDYQAVICPWRNSGRHVQEAVKIKLQQLGYRIFMVKEPGEKPSFVVSW